MLDLYDYKSLRYPMYNTVFLQRVFISIVKYSKFYAREGIINYIFSERSWCTENGYMTLRAQNQRWKTCV